MLSVTSVNVSEEIVKDLDKKNIKCVEIGHVDDSKQVSMVFEDKGKKDVIPKFRESAYTKIKQEVGEEDPITKEEMEKSIEKAALEALEKRKKIIKYIRNQK